MLIVRAFASSLYFVQTGAGGNASAHSGGIMSARKLEEATDVFVEAEVKAEVKLEF